MSETHTPGPWKDDLAPMDGVDGISIFATDEDDNLFVVASVNTPNTGLLEGDWRANSRLIAAAPDLLEAARWAREYVEQPKALEVIKDAIAKAEGREDA
jgi:hypothetical protein